MNILAGFMNTFLGLMMFGDRLFTAPVLYMRIIEKNDNTHMTLVDKDLLQLQTKNICSVSSVKICALATNERSMRIIFFKKSDFLL